MGREGALDLCPFCGDKAHLSEAMGEAWVTCVMCLAGGPAEPTVGRAVAAWNRRALARRALAGGEEDPGTLIREAIRAMPPLSTGGMGGGLDDHMRSMRAALELALRIWLREGPVAPPAPAPPVRPGSYEADAEASLRRYGEVSDGVMFKHSPPAQAACGKCGGSGAVDHDCGDSTCGQEKERCPVCRAPPAGEGRGPK